MTETASALPLPSTLADDASAQFRATDEVTDDDIGAVRAAGLSEDQIFEVAVTPSSSRSTPPDFYDAGDLTHEAMRGPSDWPFGDRELMAAVDSQANESPFCVAAHSATSTLWFRDAAESHCCPCRSGHSSDREAAAGPAAMTAGAQHLLKRGYR